MNKQLFAKVKEKTNDYGLSEKYVTALTEKLGGSVDDDSTDEQAIEQAANLIADVAKDSQGEATRWANKAKEKTKPNKKSEKNEDEDNTETEENDNKGEDKKGNPTDKRIAEMQRQIDELKAERVKGERSALVRASFDRHKIPAFIRDRFAETIPQDADVEEAVAAFKQECITNGLMPASAEGAKTASEKQVDEAADALLDSITVK